MKSVIADKCAVFCIGLKQKKDSRGNAKNNAHWFLVALPFSLVWQRSLRLVFYVAGKTAMLTPTGQAPHIPFHLGPTQAVMDTPTPTDGMPGSGGAGGYVQPPPGLGLPPGLSQPTSNMHAAQQLKGHLMKGKSPTV